MSTPAYRYNELFSQRLDTSDGQKTAAELTGTYIRDRLREVSFARGIIPPIQVTRANCQVSVNHDTLVKIIFLEPRSRAVVMTFRGQPRADYIRGEKCEAAFITISSEIYQKTEEELLCYDMPLTKVIEENVVKDIEEIEDLEFTIYCESAVQALQTEANGGTSTALNATGITGGLVVEFSIIKGAIARVQTTNTATVWPLQRPDVSNLCILLDGNRLKAEVILLTEPDWDTLMQWTLSDFGDRLQSETAIEGYKYNTLLGKRYVRTIKTDILRRGNLYCFTDPNFLGRFFVLNKTKFYIDKVANRISFQAWEVISMVLVNIASVRKLELYAYDANPTTHADGAVTNFIPVEEDQLGAVNNRVSSGLKFPQITTY